MGCLPCGDTARAATVPSRLETRSLPARLGGGWYAIGGGAWNTGAPGALGGNMAAAEADEAYPGAGGIPVASAAVAVVTADVAGVAGVAIVAAAVGAAFGGGALIVAPAPGAVVPPPAGAPPALI